MLPSQLTGIPLTSLFVILFAFGVGCHAPEASRGPATNLEPQSDITVGETGLFDPDPTAIDLVSYEKWLVLDDSQDPHPDHRKADHNCDPDGVLAEDEVLEINTDDCSYAIVGQPILHDVQAGDEVELLLYHSALSSIDQPAEGHFSLWIGDNLFWEQTVSIPASSEIYAVPLVVVWAASTGDLARIHLHNHGGNSWRVAHIRRMRHAESP